MTNSKMELTRYLIVSCMVIGICFPKSMKPRVLREINKKINLLKKSFDRQLSSHQREIDDLKFDVSDLKIELHIEKAKTVVLEELLNRTNSDAGEDIHVAANGSSTVTNQNQKELPKSSKPANNRIIQKHTREIQEVRESIESHDVAISNIKRAIQIAKDMQQKMLVCETLYKAFKEEKSSKRLALSELIKEREENKQVDQALSDGLGTLGQTVKIMSNQVEKNTNSIAVLENENQFFNETLDKALVKIKYQNRLSSALPGTITSILLRQNMTDTALIGVTRDIALLKTRLDSTYENLTSHIQHKCLDDTRAEPPTASVATEKVTISMGSTGTLRCIVTGKPEPKVTWLNSREELSSNHQVNGNVLRISHATMADRGIYVCRAENSAGADQDWAIVEVTRRQKPKIDIYPNTTQRVSVGFSALFQCRVMDGDPPPTISWSRMGGAPLTSNVEIRANGIIMFKRVTQADQDDYICTAKNNMGTITATATLLIAVAPRLKITPSNITARAGDTVQLRCTASGSGPFNFDWSKVQGQMNQHAMKRGGVLEIRQVTAADSGQYKCVVDNNSGSSEGFAIVQIEDDSTIGLPSGDVNTTIVDVGDRVSMQCIVTGTPLPTITWSRVKAPITKDAIFGDDILIIPQAKIEDAGIYTCLGVNSAGSISSKVVLYVRPRPLVTAPLVASVALGGNVSLVCDASGYSSADITWHRKDGDMPDDYTIVDGDLVISRVRPEDAGTYVCHAQNEYGTKDTPVALNVGPLVPYFDQNPQSYMSFNSLKNAYIGFDLLVSLKPKSPEGIILYNGQFDDGGGDFVCFGLKEGFPEFRFDVGSGPAVIKGDKKLDLDKWHTIQMKRLRKRGIMIVNEQPAYTGQSPGYFTGLDLQENMYLGGVPDYDKISTLANFSEGFVGSISEVKVRRINLDLGAAALEIVGVEPYNACSDRPCHNGGTCAPANQKQGFKCVCAQSFTGPLCDEIGE